MAKLGVPDETALAAMSESVSEHPRWGTELTFDRNEMPWEQS
jgi:hypothetical protein